MVLVTGLEKSMDWKVDGTSLCKVSHDFYLDNKENGILPVKEKRKW